MVLLTIVKCTLCHCKILITIKIIKNWGGGGVWVQGLDLTQNHLKLEKKTLDEEKKFLKKLSSEQDLNPRPSNYRCCT